MDTKSERLTVNVTRAEAISLSVLARDLDRSVSYVLRLAVLNLLREAAQSSTAEEVQA